MTCAEAECEWWRNGWQSTVDEDTELGKRRAGYIRTQSGRSYTEQRVGELTVFIFPAGQEGFYDPDTHPTHWDRLDRELAFTVRPGDWRRYGSEVIYDRGDQWVDDFATHQDRLARSQNG